MDYKTKYTANQDIRTYMYDHGVSQRMLADHMSVSVCTVNSLLKKELPDKEKEDLLRRIDAIIADKNEPAVEESPVDETEADEEVEETAEEAVEESNDTSVSTKFQVGDRVKIPSKQLTIGIVRDIWCSLVQHKVMYAVDTENGTRAMYAEDQLEPEPLPITYRFETTIDGNVAVCVMYATQGDQTWVYARGHAHVLHDGEVGLAQAISYSARRMFESLDTKQKNKIYFKGEYAK